MSTAGRQYSKGEWISAGVFLVVVLAVAASCWPSGKDTSSGSPAQSRRGSTSSPQHVAGPGEQRVTSASFTDWPFTVDAGTLRCEDQAVTFTPAGGTRYAVNGTAKSSGYPSITPIWADDTNLGNGLKVDISEVLDQGLALC